MIKIIVRNESRNDWGGRHRTDHASPLPRGDSRGGPACDRRPRYECGRDTWNSVEQIDHVDVFNDGRYATAQFQYEGGRRRLLEDGAMDRKWYDERIQVDTTEPALTIAFGNAFTRNPPADVKRETWHGRDRRDTARSLV